MAVRTLIQELHPGRTQLTASSFIELITDYLPVDICTQLFASLKEATPWQHETITMYGKTMPQPRLTAWFGRGLSASSRYREACAASPFPAELQSCKEMIERHCQRSFNSVLANFYRNGRDSVSWHSDDEPCLGPQPFIASLSLGEPRRFLLRSRREPQQKFALALPPGSLMLMGGRLQQEFQHAVPKTAKHIGPRINLTFRKLR